MYFTSGSDRAFEQLMQTRPGADHFDSGEAGAPEDCGTCRFYRPHWKYQFCVYEECPYQPGKRTALDGAVKFQVKGVDDEMAVFRVEKNRGYVWGGSSPSTSFDCSGFISWVINHSGWNVGRQTAQGLYNICTPVSPEQAKPGDLVFFVGTYDTAGMSHVGLYVGNSVMLHCGDPISYTNLNSSYWQQHFYCYGRLP